MQSVPGYLLAGIRVIDLMIQEMNWNHEEMGNAFRWKHNKTPEICTKDHYRFYAVRFHLAWGSRHVVAAIPTHLIAVEVHKEPTDETNPNSYYAEAEIWHIHSCTAGGQPKILRSCWYSCYSTRPIPRTEMENCPRTGRLLPPNYRDLVRGLRPNRLS